MAVEYHSITSALEISLEADAPVNTFSGTMARLLFAVHSLNSVAPIATIVCTETVGPPETYSIVVTLKDARAATVVLGNLDTSVDYMWTTASAWKSSEVSLLQSLAAAFAASLVADQLTDGTFTWS